MFNRLRDRSCENCGVRRSRTPHTPPSQSCSWTDPICQFPTSSSPHGGDKPGFCDWHAGIREGSHRGAQTDFERWIAASTPYFCDCWTHYSSEYLWAVMHGHPIARRDPSPCLSLTCPLRVTDLAPNLNTAEMHERLQSLVGHNAPEI